MPEEQLFETETDRSRAEIAETLAATAEGVEAGSVRLVSEDGDQLLDIPERATFEVELERETDPESGEQRYELEYELSWTV